MRVAIIHDFFNDLGGGERVVLKLLSIFPRSDLSTLFVNPKLTQLQFILPRNNYRVHTSSLQGLTKFIYTPGFFYLVRVYSNHFWRRLDLSAYDLVIASDFGFNSKIAGINSPAKKHISYIHDLPLWLYDRRFSGHFLPGWLAKTVRELDIAGSKLPQVILTNSKFTQAQIKHYYHRNSTVVYPPVPIPSDGMIKSHRPAYYLFFSRLDERKGIRIVIEAFNLLQKKLVVVGTGRLETEMRRIAKPNIKFLGFVPDKLLPQIFLQAKALVFCSKHEGFGMAPVEAMAYGVPVIAYAAGGVKETVIHGKTGVLFDNYSISGLISAINFFETIKISPRDCLSQAKKFSETKFEKKIRGQVNKLFK